MCRGWMWREERRDDDLAVIRWTIVNSFAAKDKGVAIAKFIADRDLGRSNAPGYESFLQPDKPKPEESTSSTDTKALDEFLGF